MFTYTYRLCLQEIYDTFLSYGTVVDCRLLSNSVIHSRGALVRMSTVEEATNAMQVGPMPSCTRQCKSISACRFALWWCGRSILQHNTSKCHMWWPSHSMLYATLQMSACVLSPTT